MKRKPFDPKVNPFQKYQLLSFISHFLLLIRSTQLSDKSPRCSLYVSDSRLPFSLFQSCRLRLIAILSTDFLIYHTSWYKVYVLQMLRFPFTSKSSGTPVKLNYVLAGIRNLLGTAPAPSLDGWERGGHADRIADDKRHSWTLLKSWLNLLNS